eukprot:CAMPEP_0168612450 /NCGR_PEP_ID=MMETSP0449_2-20121227/2925_1 /TAXON_ID=1082188 /ORGANISM="Strombidium rassoulzadegani, Strain ras09" /LENGTH=161 /DNA_ID=CAMNT_0008653019 /DNA_START=226 /DNA_END=711 /DNA_ORIENTATION=+
MRVLPKLTTIAFFKFCPSCPARETQGERAVSRGSLLRSLGVVVVDVGDLEVLPLSEGVGHALAEEDSEGLDLLASFRGRDVRSVVLAKFLAALQDVKLDPRRVLDAEEEGAGVSLPPNVGNSVHRGLDLVIGDLHEGLAQVDNHRVLHRFDRPVLSVDLHL